VVCSIRGSDIHSYPYRSKVRLKLTKNALRASTAVVSVSKSLAEEAQLLAGCRPIVIYNGIGEQFVKPSADTRETARRALGLNEYEKAILFVGRCEAEKGMGELMESWCQLSGLYPNWILLIAGGYQPESIGNLEQSGSGFERIRWLGIIPPEKMPELYAAADLFVLPTWGEGMPNALLEAMGSGLPSIATPVGGIPEVIVDGVTGLLVPARNSERLTEGIKSLLLDPKRSVIIGSNASEMVHEKMSWQLNARNHIDLYSAILDRPQ